MTLSVYSEHNVCANYFSTGLNTTQLSTHGYFENGDKDPGTDCLVTEDGEQSKKTTTTSSTGSHESEKSMLTKIKSFVDKSPKKHREMNLLQPQGSSESYNLQTVR